MTKLMFLSGSIHSGFGSYAGSIVTKSSFHTLDLTSKTNKKYVHIAVQL